MRLISFNWLFFLFFFSSVLYSPSTAMLDLSWSKMTELASSFPELLFVAVAEMISAFCLACFFFFSLGIKKGKQWQCDLLHAIQILCCGNWIWDYLINKTLCSLSHPLLLHSTNIGFMLITILPPEFYLLDLQTCITKFRSSSIPLLAELGNKARICTC